MRYRDLASVALKTLGVYWLVQALFYVERGILLPFSDFPRMAGLDLGVEIIDWGLRGILLAVVGYLLTFRTTSVMGWIKIDGAQDVDTSSSERANHLEALAISLLGVYFVVPAIGGMAPIAIKFLSLRSPADNLMRQGYMEQIWPRLVGNIVEFVLGLILIIGRSGLVRLWRLSRPMANEQ